MHPCTNPLSSHLAPPSPAPLLLASRAWRCSSGPCSINEPACLMKRTQPVWLGGDGNTNSCCHHRWGITPLHQLPLLIYHTHTHAHGLMRTYTNNCSSQTFRFRTQDWCRCSRTKGWSFSLSFCVGPRLRDSALPSRCLHHLHPQLPSFWVWTTPSLCLLHLLSHYVQ